MEKISGMSHITSFDQRVVRYEEIHNVQPEDFAVLTAAAEVRDCSRILDCGCGYGAVTREILIRTEEQRRRKGQLIAIDLVDESREQLKRAKEELKPWLNDPLVQLTFYHGYFPDAFKWSKRYDVVAAKMVLHEVVRGKQAEFVDGLYECLKDNGRLLLWDLFLTPETADFFRETIKEKDRLAKFNTMVDRRHFLSDGELVELLSQSRFSFCKLIKPIEYKFETSRRLVPEFNGDKNLLNQWHDFIRNMAATKPLVQDLLHYQDDKGGGTIRFQVRKAIFSCRRAEHLCLVLKPFTPGAVDLPSSTNRALVYPSIVEQSFADGKLSRILQSRSGLIRTSLLTHAYGGGRELWKEGLDYLYNSDDASSTKQAEAYIAHLTWLYYGRRDSLRSRQIRSISDALSDAFRDASTGAWMTVTVIDGFALEISMGTPMGVEGKVTVSLPRYAKTFFEHVTKLVRAEHKFSFESLADPLIRRLRTSTGKSIDRTAIELARDLSPEWGDVFKKLASAKMEVTFSVENTHLVSFLENSKEVLVPLLEFLVCSGTPTLHYLLPPTLTTSEQGRLEEGVFILSTNSPVSDDVFLELLALVAGLWSGLGALEAEVAGRMSQKEEEQAKRLAIVAGASHAFKNLLTPLRGGLRSEEDSPLQIAIRAYEKVTSAKDYRPRDLISRMRESDVIVDPDLLRRLLSVASKVADYRNIVERLWGKIYSLHISSLDPETIQLERWCVEVSVPYLIAGSFFCSWYAFLEDDLYDRLRRLKGVNESSFEGVTLELDCISDHGESPESCRFLFQPRPKDGHSTRSHLEVISIGSAHDIERLRNSHAWRPLRLPAVLLEALTEEALFNAIKYGDFARPVRVLVDCRCDQLSVEIQNDIHLEASRMKTGGHGYDFLKLLTKSCGGKFAGGEVEGKNIWQICADDMPLKGKDAT